MSVKALVFGLLPRQLFASVFGGTFLFFLSLPGAHTSTFYTITATSLHFGFVQTDFTITFDDVTGDGLFGESSPTVLEPYTFSGFDWQSYSYSTETDHLTAILNAPTISGIANGYSSPSFEWYFIDPDSSHGIGGVLGYHYSIWSYTIAPAAAPAAPLPAALPLFASGLGALGLLGWRRKWRATARAAA